MRLIPEQSPWPRLLVFPFGILGLFGILLGRFAPDFLLRTAHCPLREWTGFPCPTCGGTHATISMVQGKWAAGFAANPGIAAGMIVAVIWILAGIVATVFPGLRRSIMLTAGEKKTARILAVVLLLMVWIWEIRRNLG
jgi:hypothetical protein